MNLKQVSFSNLARLDIHSCVLNENLDEHIDIEQYKSIVLAGAFPSGSANNPTAISFVFYFFTGEADKFRRPDDILTFKVKTTAPDRVHMIDKYLGGVSFGAENAAPLSQFYG